MPTRRTVLVGLAATLAGCGQPEGSEAVPGTPTPPAPVTDAWYTHARPTGNRTLEGRGDLRSADRVSFAPEGRPRWLVARPDADGSHWTVATADGRVTDWRVTDGSATRIAEWASIPPETPPVVTAGPDGAGLLSPPSGISVRASPAVTASNGATKLLYVAGNGDLVVAGSETTRLPVDGLPDGRLAALGDGRYALFGDTTGRYQHGALGDDIETETLYVVDATTADITAQSSLDAPAVFEGLQPLVADLNDDGTPEIITTVADASVGARIAVFSPDGERLATGPVHAPGWRHQLTVAPFGPDGRPELAVVRKPHVDRLLEFYRLDDGVLDVAATAPGFSSHSYGSRILDQAVAGRFSDGSVDLLVPTRNRTTLAAVHREGDDATTDWSLPLAGSLSSNVTGTTRPDEGVAVGAATDSTVHVWQA